MWNANSKISKYLSNVWLRYKRKRGACKSTPVHAVQSHRLFPNKHSPLQVLCPSQQHCHFTSVDPTLINSTSTHTEEDVGCSLSLSSNAAALLQPPVPAEENSLYGCSVAMQTQLYFLTVHCRYANTTVLPLTQL